MTADIYGSPILTAREASRYLVMPESTLDLWLSVDEALVHSVVPERRGWPRIPFIGVVEAYVLRSLRDLRMPMADIREAVKLVRHELDDPYALAHRRLATDGVAVFADLAERGIVHARTGQLGIGEVLADYLKYIEWDDGGQARRLNLRDFPESAQVIIDPRFGRGMPVLGKSKVRVVDLVDLWRAGESIVTVADEYGLPVGVVEDVLRRAA